MDGFCAEVKVCSTFYTLVVECMSGYRMSVPRVRQGAIARFICRSIDQASNKVQG